MIVWNYQSKNVEILQITQRGIQESLLNYLHDVDFGEPKGYDIVIKRDGEGLETKYQVLAKPPKALDKDIAQAYEDKDPIDLTKLYEGGNPFEAGESGEIEVEDNPLSDSPFG